MLHWLHKWVTANLWETVRTGADVLIVWYLIYRLMMLARGTRAWQIISGLLVFVFILWVSAVCQFTALNMILQKMFLLGPVAIVILFYPELRHALEEVGRWGFWGRGFTTLDKEDLSLIISEIVRAAEMMSAKKIGALIVFERNTGLTDHIETGTLVNADVSTELLGTIFYPGSPLHDGAVVIRRDRIIAAGCTLPLSENRGIGTQVHTRHKAALGLSEQSDAIILVVSEETGIISTVFEGRMVRGQHDTLQERILDLYMGRERAVLRRRRARTRPAAARPSAVPVITNLAEEAVSESQSPAEARL